MTRAVVISLARDEGMGERRRVASWRSILEAAGTEVTEVSLLRDHRRGVHGNPAVGVGPVLRGRAVPETLAWSQSSVRQRLVASPPAIVVCVTARAFHPTFGTLSVPVVLDFVDRLSVSYRYRAAITRNLAKRALFLGLSHMNRRFEQRRPPPGIIITAAGWEEAATLGGCWVPNVVSVPPRVEAREPDTDVLFFGNLAYSPNIAGLRQLASMWPAVLARRPATTCLVAGAHPGRFVRRLAANNGWELQPFFTDLGALCGRARVAVTPIQQVTGIQNKVLEAGAHGVPQVVTPEVLRGLKPGFPAVVADNDGAFVDAVVESLDNPAASADLAARARTHIMQTYTSTSWVATARSLIEGADLEGARSPDGVA